MFKIEMVRAIQEGRKTQTRRIVTHPARMGCLTGDCEHETQSFCDRAVRLWADSECPYGKEGDRLWVREAWRTSLPYEDFAPSELQKIIPIQYEAGGTNIPDCDSTYRCGRLRPAKYMCRWMSRITLEITRIRVDRLKYISTKDAIEEGIQKGFTITGGEGYGLPEWPIERFRQSPVDAYQFLWESINGPGSWDENPWVFAIEFKDVTKQLQNN